MKMIQFEKGRMFDTSTRKLYENAPDDSGIVENSRGRWFVDYANGIPSREGWDAFLNIIRTLEGFRGTVTALLDIPGQSEPGGYVRCRVFDQPGGRVVRTFNVGQELKLIVADESGWRRGNALTSL